jgi:putative oxidoreductase
MAGDPRPIFPTLGRYYGFTSDLAYLVVRVTIGLMLIPHGWPKVTTSGVVGVAGALTRYGIVAPTAGAYTIMALETLGAVMITLGLFTRAVAALLVIEFAVIVFVAHWPRGYGAGAGGIEFPLMWGMMLVAIMLRGGGPWSLDRRIGKEI